MGNPGNRTIKSALVVIFEKLLSDAQYYSICPILRNVSFDEIKFLFCTLYSQIVGYFKYYFSKLQKS